MATDQSQNVAAVIETANAQITITTRPVPQPGPNEILVRNYAVAANPLDWKVQTHGIFVTKVC
jgi:NADPH:quinone reductase-like Zn-dependent oxidoreductase